MEYDNQILFGDCEEVLKNVPENSVDLIFTSPPYADQRVKSYGGIKPDEYGIGSCQKQNNFCAS